MILGIYGAGGFGREVLMLSQIINKIERRWSEIIFIDDIHPNTTIKNSKTLSYLDFKKTYDETEAEIIIAVGEPSSRNIMATKVECDNYKLAILIHPDVFISECTTIGVGTIISKGSYISCDVSIGKNVVIQHNVIIGHDTRIDDNSIISGHGNISGNCSIGKDVYVALSVCVKECVSIGDGTIIGMGGVVVRDMPNDIIAVGNPARIVKNNETHMVFK